MSDLGYQLRSQRKAQRLTLRTAGEITGVCYATLSAVENGYEPTARVRAKIVAWLSAAPPPRPQLPSRPQPKTLRDEIAIAALTGLLAKGYATPEVCARWSYAYADAMMVERET